MYALSYIYIHIYTCNIPLGMEPSTLVLVFKYNKYALCYFYLSFPY